MFSQGMRQIYITVLAYTNMSLNGKKTISVGTQETAF